MVVNFSIRVVMRGATWAQYTQLANNLAKVGIVDEITADNGVRYKLPDAEYVFAGAANLTAEHVRAHVQAEVNKITVNSAVYVTQGTSRAWSGLPVVSANSKRA